MVQKTFTITNKMGLHMRPANTFVTEMSKFSSDVDIVSEVKGSTARAL